MENLKKTGYTKSTPQHYVVDAGAIYKNLKFENGKWEGELLGATADGNEVNIEKEFRQIEVDGVFTNAIGQTVLQSVNAKVTVNIKEITAENLRLAMGGVLRDAEEGEAPEGYKVIEGKGQIDCEDYLENIALVGTLTGSTQPIIFIFDNALVTGGLEFETTDDDEAVIPVEFTAHADADNVDDRKAPVKILYPEVDKAITCNDKEAAVKAAKTVVRGDK